MSRGQWLNTYTPTYARRLHSYATSGFFARDLDAEDHAFIEGVRERGCINGGLAAAVYQPPEQPLPGEQEFWVQQWGTEPGIERRIGPPPGTKLYVPTGIGSNEWHARRAQLRQDRAMAAEELKRERQAWQQQQNEYAIERANRLLRMRQADLEWEQARPTMPARPGWEFGQSVQEYEKAQKDWHRRRRTARHYAPEWKHLEAETERMDEFYARNVKRWRKHAKAALKLAREVAAGRAETEQLKAEQQARAQAQQQARALKAEQKGECERGTCRADTCCPIGICLAANPLYGKLAAQIATVSITHIITPRPALESPEAMALKRFILEIMRSAAPGTPWSAETLMQRTSCTNQPFLVACCEDIVREGHMRSKSRWGP